MFARYTNMAKECLIVPCSSYSSCSQPNSGPTECRCDKNFWHLFLSLPLRPLLRLEFWGPKRSCIDRRMIYVNFEHSFVKFVRHEKCFSSCKKGEHNAMLDHSDDLDASWYRSIFGDRNALFLLFFQYFVFGNWGLRWNILHWDSDALASIRTWESLLIKTDRSFMESWASHPYWSWNKIQKNSWKSNC